MATNDAEAVDFEPDEDDLMDEDAAGPQKHSEPPKLRSTITGGDVPRKTKGRGFRDRGRRFVSRVLDSLSSNGGPRPQRSIEGWVILVTGVHEEAQEDDLHNTFCEYGEVNNLHLNLDRWTGFVKGYAFIEYENYEEALVAIQSLNGAQLLDQIISVE